MRRLLGLCGCRDRRGRVSRLPAVPALLTRRSWALANNAPIGNGELSVEQILGCDVTDGVNGCNGGYIYEALLWTWGSSKGLVADGADPFTCAKGCSQPPACPNLRGYPTASINSTCSCSWAGNETSMASALFKVHRLLAAPH